ncbi:unnamed protein product [Rotaria sordida]|uniref:Peptidase M16 N-terminal domain-containing protein n=1 Tax=Rotaria sordida TaxID=392033 RepID=A0A815JEB1_9BILA|nr:unnamed protein product [Rotaria sordida]CAF3869102.1 unnamed protein product [Rotaria sordida]
MWNYRGLELSNGMLCVPISHPSIDMGAAALDISIGSLADPRDVPGIAHFLEHMLFMGSTKNSLYQKLQSLVLADGEYYELVRSNFERADHQSDVHVMTMFFFFHIQLI